jgi:hypothetical protein
MREQRDATVVEVSSPDAQIFARLSGQDDVTLWFAPGVYVRYDEHRLAHQLGRLATLLWVASRQAYQRAWSEATGTPASSRGPQETRRRDFRQAQLALTVTGISPYGFVTVYSAGLLSWEVDLREGTCRQLSEQEFVQETLDAARMLLDDYFAKTHRLKDEYFDLRLHEAWQGHGSRR